MCGIFGIIFQDRRQDLGGILLAAGRRLTYRGYDSVGMGVFDGDRVDLRKDVGKIDEVNQKLHFEEMQGYKGIVQPAGPPSGSPCRAMPSPTLTASSGWSVPITETSSTPGN